MIETSAPPYIYCSLLFSPLQKKNDYQRTETVSLGEVKHLVSFLDKGEKKKHHQSFLGKDASARFSWPSSAPKESLQAGDSGADISLRGLALTLFWASMQSASQCNFAICVLSRTAMLQLMLSLEDALITKTELVQTQLTELQWPLL